MALPCSPDEPSARVPRARRSTKRCGADPGSRLPSITWTPDQRRTVALRFTLRRIRGTHFAAWHYIVGRMSGATSGAPHVAALMRSTLLTMEIGQQGRIGRTDGVRA